MKKSFGCTIVVLGAILSCVLQSDVLGMNLPQPSGTIVGANSPANAQTKPNIVEEIIQLEKQKRALRERILNTQNLVQSINDGSIEALLELEATLGRCQTTARTPRFSLFGFSLPRLFGIDEANQYSSQLLQCQATGIGTFPSGNNEHPESEKPGTGTSTLYGVLRSYYYTEETNGGTLRGCDIRNRQSGGTSSHEESPQPPTNTKVTLLEIRKSHEAARERVEAELAEAEERLAGAEANLAKKEAEVNEKEAETRIQEGHEAALITALTNRNAELTTRILDGLMALYARYNPTSIGPNKHALPSSTIAKQEKENNTPKLTALQTALKEKRTKNTEELAVLNRQLGEFRNRCERYKSQIAAIKEMLHDIASSAVNQLTDVKNQLTEELQQAELDEKLQSERIKDLVAGYRVYLTYVRDLLQNRVPHGNLYDQTKDLLCASHGPAIEASQQIELLLTLFSTNTQKLANAARLEHNENSEEEKWLTYINTPHAAGPGLLARCISCGCYAAAGALRGVNVASSLAKVAGSLLNSVTDGLGLRSAYNSVSRFVTRHTPEAVATGLGHFANLGDIVGNLASSGMAAFAATAELNARQTLLARGCAYFGGSLGVGIALPRVINLAGSLIQYATPLASLAPQTLVTAGNVAVTLGGGAISMVTGLGGLLAILQAGAQIGEPLLQGIGYKLLGHTWPETFLHVFTGGNLTLANQVFNGGTL